MTQKNSVWDISVTYPPIKLSAYRRICIVCRKIFTASPAETYDEQGNYIEYICTDCKKKEGIE